MEKKDRKDIELKDREILENVIKATNVGTWQWNINTSKFNIDKRYAEILGYKLEELKDFNINKWNKMMREVDLIKTKKLLDQHFKGENEFYNNEVRLKNKKGKLVWSTHRGKVIKWNSDGSPKIMFGTIYDDTERKKAEEEKLKLTMAIEQSTITVLMTDAEGIIEYVNPAFEKNTGYLAEEVTGKKTIFIDGNLNPKNILEELKESLTNGKTWEGEIINRKKNGEIYYEEARITPVVGVEGKIISFLSIKQDITKRKALEKRLREASIRDDLTNIYNRRYVFERLKEISELYKRKKDIFSIAILDIDYFKNVNDTYGHPGGDYILQEFSKFLKKSIRSSDILGRYGGEEFIIIFMDSNKEYSRSVVDRIRRKVKQKKFQYKGNDIQFTFSGGVSDASESDISKFSFEYLINEADKRLYKAKDTGRDRVLCE